ncbi:MAG: hypothetical protein WC964_03465 [Acholeplasmataceae bacterium]
MKNIIKQCTFLLIVLLVIAVSACQGQMTVEKVIDLIQVAEKEDENSITRAQNAFDKLSENEKRAVSNYTKLYYLNHEPPTTHTIETKFNNDELYIAYFTFNPYYRVVKSKDDIKNLFFFVDFEDLLDGIDDDIFENKTVIATTENDSWRANPAEEELWVYLDSQYNRLKLYFIKMDYPIFGISTQNIRLIVLDTVYPLDILEINFFFLPVNSNN